MRLELKQAHGLLPRDTTARDRDRPETIIRVPYSLCRVEPFFLVASGQPQLDQVLQLPGRGQGRIHRGWVSMFDLGV